MSYTRWREEFIARMSREGMRLDVTRALLRHASTLQRLAVAQCNGDWPSDNGQRKVDACDECGSGWVPSVLKRLQLLSQPGRPTLARVCPDCRTQERVRAVIAADAPAWKAIFGGDPRGAVLKLARVDARIDDIHSGRAETIGVPGRER